MDSFNITHFKAVKAKAIRKHRKIEKLTNMFRLLEILVVLAVISRFSVHLPVVAKISGEYFKDLGLALASPRFVFVVGNVIVIVLFAKSGHLPGQEGKGKRSTKADLYEEFVEMSGKGPQPPPPLVKQRVETEHRRKQSKSNMEMVVKEEVNVPPPASLGIVKSYERSQSEKVVSKSIVSRPEKELKRSVTEKFVDRTSDDCGKMKKKEKGSFPEDNMSNEEFKSTIEAFIERQKRFRRDEEISVFVG